MWLAADTSATWRDIITVIDSIPDAVSTLPLPMQDDISDNLK